MDAESYLMTFSKQIKNYEVRRDIMREYKDHIMDCKEALMDSGFSEENAEEEAVRQMGDPAEAGFKMNRVYQKLVDWDMVIWMLAAYAFMVCLIFLYNLLNPIGPDGQRDYSTLADGVPAVVHWCIGIALAVYGIALSVFEKYTGKPLFYGYARDWGGHYLANSGLMFILSILFLYTDFIRSLCLILAYCIIQIFLRAFMTLLRERKESRLLWMTGVADCEITYKGKGTIGQNRIKMRAQDSEKGMKIPAGAPIMVVELKGFQPIVTQI